MTWTAAIRVSVVVVSVAATLLPVVGGSASPPALATTSSPSTTWTPASEQPLARAGLLVAYAGKGDYWASEVGSQDAFLLFDTEGRSIDFPSFSSDGRTLVFSDDGNVALLDVVSRVETLLTDSHTDYAAQFVNGEIMFLRGGDLWSMQFDGSNARLVDTLCCPQGQRLRVSPDGTRLAYAENGQIVVREIGQRPARVLTSGSEEKGLPVWTPDGRSLAYWEQSTGIGMIDADGSNQRIVVRDEGARPTMFSPDGKILVSNDAGYVDLDTGATTSFHPTGPFIDLHWRPMAWQPIPTCTFSGTDGADALAGTAGDDVICAGSGDDTVVESAGEDIIMAGQGRDRLVAAERPEGVSIDLTRRNVLGAGHSLLTSVEDAAGTSGDDQLVGTYRDNLLDGRAGDDLMDGVDGGDQLAGGPGRDTLSYARSWPWLEPGPPDGYTIDLAAGHAARDGDASNDDVVPGFENAIGSPEADVVFGDSGANELVTWVDPSTSPGDAYWSSGTDVFDGRGGDDVYRATPGTGAWADYRGTLGPVAVDLDAGVADGPDGHDQLVNIDRVYGTAYDDVLRGGTYLVAGAGADHLRPGPHPEVACGSGADVADFGASTAPIYMGSEIADAGHNPGPYIVIDTADCETLFLSEFADHVGATSGSDVVFGRGGDDLIFGHEGDDTLWGGPGRDSLAGGSGNDYLVGQLGPDGLTGQQGVDVLLGNRGPDGLIGGAGRDQHFGQRGSDSINSSHDGFKDLVHGGPAGDACLVDRIDVVYSCPGPE